MRVIIITAYLMAGTYYEGFSVGVSVLCILFLMVKSRDGPLGFYVSFRLQQSKGV